MGDKASPAIIVELEGPGVSPDNVDPFALIDLAHHYLALLRKVAEERGIDLGILAKIAVVKKCAGIAIAVADEDPVQEAHEGAMSLLRAGASAGHALQRHLDNLGQNVKASVTFARSGVTAPLEVPKVVIAPVTFDGIEHARHIRIVRAGGEHGATVRVFDYTTQKGYTLSATKDFATAAGLLLFQDALADIEFTYELEAMKITDGRMVRKPVRFVPWTVDGFVEFVQQEFDPPRPKARRRTGAIPRRRTPR